MKNKKEMLKFLAHCGLVTVGGLIISGFVVLADKIDDKHNRIINANKKSYDELKEKSELANKQLNDSLQVWTQRAK